MFKFLFSFLFLLAALATDAQTAALVAPVEGFRQRILLEAQPGRNDIQITQLEPGNVYTVVFVGAAEGQQAEFTVSPAAGLRAQKLSGKTNAFQFSATTSEAVFQLKASTPHKVSAIPFYLSVKCETCAEAAKTQQDFLNQLAPPPIQTTQGATGQDLITNVLIGGNCFGVSNVSTFGNALSRGTFTNGASSINIQEGMIMATGRTNVVEGPNSEPNANEGFGNNSPDDPDLAWLTNGNQYDKSIIEFDFTPSANFVQFEFVFGSEEYCEYVGTQFNDVFGFFISGPGFNGNENLAVVGGNTPISINTVNYVNNAGLFVNNDIYSAQCSGLQPFNILDCQLDGWTVKLTAQTQLTPCATYHIKLAIADIGDGIFDSAVFLKANSFNAGGTVSASPLYAFGQPAAYENCGPNFIKFSRGTGGNAQPLTINYSISPASTATSGVDYQPIPTSVTIPAGQNDILVPVTVLADGLAEGQEKIILLIDNLCSCTQGIVEFLINDYNPLSVVLNDTISCNSNVPVTISPIVSGGLSPYTYAWSIGETTESITIVGNGLIGVTVTDVCLQSQSDDAQVAIGAAILIDTTLFLCPGATVALGGSNYSAPDTVTLNLPGTGGACDTTINYFLQLLPNATLTDTIQFCPGSSVTIGDSTYFQPTTIEAVLPGQNGACDTLATYVLEQLPNATLTDTIQFCSGSSVTIGDSTYTQPTTVEAVLPGQNGACDTLATYVLQLLPEITRTETISFCPGESVTIAGTTYTETTTFVITVNGTGGACDTLVTYNLIKLPQPTTNASYDLCPGATLTLGGTAYAAPDTVLLTLPGQNGDCDTLATYVLNLLPYQTSLTTLSFCPGDSVTINGQIYTTEGTVTDTIPDPNGGCDIIATYVLESLTPAPSNVVLLCPASISVTIPAGNTGEVISYNDPFAATDCICPGLDVAMTYGLPSGSLFPVGVTDVCFAAEDKCGNTATCCFKVSVQENPPCDVKQIDCMKWELLTITQDAALNKTYRIRFTNFCSNTLSYALIQLPNGVVATEPVDNSIYTAPSGREYQVRNPNLTTFYSIRFNSLLPGINSGQSDIFKYTLPPTATPNYIHVAVRLFPRLYYESHLNTFFCPIGVTPNAANDGAFDLQVFPNPTNGNITVDLSLWAEQQVQLRVYDARGQLVLQNQAYAEYAPQTVLLPEGLESGLYFLEVQAAEGERVTTRFAVQR
ncbi:MAG: choice-of-anchor L domain-containing protein [Saprospiraceae bacterium]|nr:choice-of-anchor L domain-containing protein [Saprospiraceae bacterium]